MAATLMRPPTGTGESWPMILSLLLLLLPFLPPTQVAATALRHPAREGVAISRDVGRTLQAQIGGGGPSGESRAFSLQGWKPSLLWPSPPPT